MHVKYNDSDNTKIVIDSVKEFQMGGDIGGKSSDVN